jgi:hypothetical protein
VFTVHLPYGFSSIKLQTVTQAGAQFGQPGYETALLYLAALQRSCWEARVGLRWTPREPRSAPFESEIERVTFWLPKLSGRK